MTFLTLYYAGLALTSTIVTTTSTSTTTWSVPTSIKVPYTTYRVITIPVHTYNMTSSYITSSSELYPTSVLTEYCTNTTMIVDVLTTSTPVYDPYYITSSTMSTETVTATSTSCATWTVDPSWPTQTGW